MEIHSQASFIYVYDVNVLICSSRDRESQRGAFLLQMALELVLVLLEQLLLPSS